MGNIAIRIFYRKATNQIVYSFQAVAPEGVEPVFSSTPEQELLELPEIKPDGITPLGGVPDDYAYIEIVDAALIAAFLASDTNQIVAGQLVVGAPRPEPLPDPTIAIIEDYLSNSPETITGPKVGYLLRAFGKKLGYKVG